ncbi:MAG: hypothetical protein ACFFCS_22020 [Candidatus Hodarchaeota archaeon]
MSLDCPECNGKVSVTTPYGITCTNCGFVMVEGKQHVVSESLGRFGVVHSHDVLGRGMTRMGFKKERASRKTKKLARIQGSSTSYPERKNAMVSNEVSRLVSCLSLPSSLVRDTMRVYERIREHVPAYSPMGNVGVVSAALLYLTARKWGKDVEQWYFKFQRKRFLDFYKQHYSNLLQITESHERGEMGFSNIFWVLTSLIDCYFEYSAKFPEFDHPVITRRQIADLLGFDDIRTESSPIENLFLRLKNELNILDSIRLLDRPGWKRGISEIYYFRGMKPSYLKKVKEKINNYFEKIFKKYANTIGREIIGQDLWNYLNNLYKIEK